MAKLVDPKVITDINQELVCILPIGFDFDDAAWNIIWQEYDRQEKSLNMEDLKFLFPDDASLKIAQKPDKKGHKWCDNN
jgi:hypothetical protein